MLIPIGPNRNLQTRVGMPYSTSSFLFSPTVRRIGIECKCVYNMFTHGIGTNVAHKRLANSILPQDLVDSMLFCLVYLPHFVWFREVNQTKPNSNLFQPKNFLIIFKNEISWPPLNPLGPNINWLKWYFPQKSQFNLFLTRFNQGIYFSKIFLWFDSGWV